MPVLNRSADRFQRALDGERITDEGLVRLVETSRHLVALTAAVPAADAEFVATLRERLMAEAARMPAQSPVAAKAAAARRAASRTTPVVVVVGRGLPRLLAGAAASAILVGGVVGVVSRGAVPGQALYPVKGWLDGVAVRLADNDLERGQTYLAQAQEHISDARQLADRDTKSADDINTALSAATDSVRKGRQALDTSYATTGNPQALIAMRDFTARTLPQLEALRTEVPAGSLPQLATLEALLRDTEQSTSRRIAACGSACTGAVSSTLGPSSLPGSATTAPTGSPTGRFRRRHGARHRGDRARRCARARWQHQRADRRRRGRRLHRRHRRGQRGPADPQRVRPDRPVGHGHRAAPHGQRRHRRGGRHRARQHARPGDTARRHPDAPLTPAPPADEVGQKKTDRRCMSSE